MPGLGIPPEKFQERMAELQRRKYSFPTLEIPQEDVIAAIMLCGGEAYCEDIEWVLKNLFNHEIKNSYELGLFLEYIPGLEWDLDEKGDKIYWRIERNFWRKYEKDLKERMRKTMGYKKSGLEALFDNQEEGKELSLWENYKDK
jgi:hypothetical protein